MMCWWSDAERELSEAVIAEFKKEHPEIDVKDNYVPGNDYLSKLNTMIAAKTTPDIFYLNENLINEWGEKGVSRDLRPLYEKEGINLDEFFIPTALYKTGDSLWGVNFSSTTICLYYNKEMMRGAGITPPSTSAVNP